LVSISRGIRAEHVDGMSPDRVEILGRFRRDETRLLSNAMLLTEGYDEPSVDCVVCLRPTKVRALYAQIVGRGTRIHPGKSELLLVDFLWQSEEHGLIRPAHLAAQSEAEARAIDRHLAAGGDLLEAKEAADEDRRRTLAERLAANRHRPSRLFDAVEFAVALRDLTMSDFEPTMRWHVAPVSDKQTAVLARHGIDPQTVKGKGHACAIIQRIFDRRALGLASVKQVYWLAKCGHPNPELCSAAEATQFLSRRWRRAA
jgi:hypothetical protein